MKPVLVQTPQRRSSRWWLIAVLCGALALVGCQTPEPGPTPTATRTPIVPTPTPTLTPTPTPTATATPTVTPSPTLPPGLVLPPLPARADTCPPLPSDLAFLRGGELRICLAEGGAMDRVSISTEATGQAILAYRMATGGGRIVYLTDAGELWVLDRAERVHTRMPTAGRLVQDGTAYFDLADGGETIIYLAWGVQAGGGPAVAPPESGTLFSLSIEDPADRQVLLGSCAGSPASPCRGFVLSPDETALAIVDAVGIWRIERAAPGEPRLVGSTTDARLRVHSWSPDGRWLLLEAPDDGDPPELALLSTESGELPVASTQLCPTVPCALGVAWSTPAAAGSRLWVTWDTADQGCVGRVTPDPAQPLHPLGLECLAATIPLRPRSPATGSAIVTLGATLAFLQGGRGEPVDGLYALNAEAATDEVGAQTLNLLPIALMAAGVGTPDAPWSVLWSEDGNAFVVADAGNQPVYMGTLSPPAFWEVSGLLEGAHDLRWTQREQAP